MIELREHQVNAIAMMHNGCVLYSGVGAGKSATALGYYVKKESPREIYVITTAKKRDSLDWLGEAAKFGIGTELEGTLHGRITVDSWNNIDKYTCVDEAFFIFDEQRLVGTGPWVKSFLRIARKNQWVMLSATPADAWIDYAPLFVANGWYKNISDFKRQHVLYAPYVRFPKIARYIEEDRLERLRGMVLVEMPYASIAHRHTNYLAVGYDHERWDLAVKHRWNPYTDQPIKDVGELFRVMRRISNEDPSRLETVRDLMKIHPRLIVFYNFNYELEILRGLGSEVALGEWNGHKKEAIPDTERWVYLVQYTSGAEGWNCLSTNAMILYSLTYSYKNFIQAMGRIDRLDRRGQPANISDQPANIELFYYILVSGAQIDRDVRAALEMKKSFNERKMAKNGNYPAFICRNRHDDSLFAG